MNRRRRRTSARGGIAFRAKPSGGTSAPGPILVLVLVALLGALGRSTASHAQSAPAADPWIGKRVITQHGTVLQVAGRAIDDENRGKNLARGKDIRKNRVYMVKQVNGPWLWLVAEGASVKGWAPAVNAIPFEQAIDYITGLIRANPGDSTKYTWRGNVWLDRKEYDIAIADYNEAIRLDPGDAAVPYFDRGNAWELKKEHDKAIVDYGEAIRLDPTYAVPYNGRGDVWYNKNDYDKAIADYGEAIRLV